MLRPGAPAASRATVRLYRGGGAAGLTGPTGTPGRGAAYLLRLRHPIWSGVQACVYEWVYIQA